MPFKATIISVLLVLTTAVFAGPIPQPHVPNPNATPGDLCSRNDADFQKFRYKQRIAYCARNVSSSLKAEIYDEYGIRESLRRSYTIDHFIPLSIGGNNSKENLWPEHKKIKLLRINLETEVYEAIRDGKMTQEEGIQKIIKAKLNPPLPSANDYYQLEMGY